MPVDNFTLFSTFAAVASVILLLGSLLGSRKDPVEARLSQVGAGARRGGGDSNPALAGRGRLPRIGAVLMPEDEGRRSRLRSRMYQAGLYRRQATALFLGVKLLMMVAPMAVGVVLATMGMLPMTHGILFGVFVGLFGTIAPSIWLGFLKAQRQKNIRRALPDALDVIVICLEGGLSLSGSFSRVASELKDAHPLLATEMSIVQKEIQLGRTTGEAMRQFADRFDAEELRSLASVIMQAEKFGASVVKALRVHADTLRLKRHQYAEAQAQKAPVKLIFPTVLCIFPALYIALMGPAGIILWEMLGNLGR